MKKSLVVLIVVGVLLVASGIFVYQFYFSSPEYSESSVVALRNPVEGLSDQQALEAFDKNFVSYLLYNIGANELHNPPLSKNTPKIEIRIEDEIYSAEIVKGSIRVGTGEIGGNDIVITTSRVEVVKMLRDPNYVAQSFREGNSGIELAAGKTLLASKGYIGLYEKLTGEEII